MELRGVTFGNLRAQSCGTSLQGLIFYKKKPQESTDSRTAGYIMNHISHSKRTIENIRSIVIMESWSILVSTNIFKSKYKFR